jgi:heme-degrading monooxygenase HmoA
MYMRLVYARSKPDLVWKIQQVYAEKIVPRLKEMPGCLCSCLIQSDAHEDEGISMTLWDTEAHADAYEQSGVFRQLLGEVRPYLSDSSEWKIELSKDLKLEYHPVPEEPVLKAYSSFAQVEEKVPSEREFSLMHIRIFSLTIKPGMMEEFRKIYKEEILPALRLVKGCRYAFMTENTQNKSEVLSLTIWDSKEDSINYEKSELFGELIKKVKHTFSELFQFKAALEKEARGKVVTTQDPYSLNYNIVTGKFFNT